MEQSPPTAVITVRVVVSFFYAYVRNVVLRNISISDTTIQEFYHMVLKGMNAKYSVACYLTTNSRGSYDIIAHSEASHSYIKPF